MLHRLVLRVRYLTLLPILGLLAACLALYARGLRLVLQQFHAAFFEHATHLNGFEVEILEGIDLLLVGTGCLALAIGMFTLFVRELDLPRTLRFRNFHEVKGLFANFIILAMAIAFLEQFNSIRESDNPQGISGFDILASGAGMALVTVALLAFKYWGGERAPRDEDPAAH
jgi:uncharacterized membrane protein YqhA